MGFQDGIANRSRFLRRKKIEQPQPPVQDFRPIDDAVNLIIHRYNPKMVIVYGPSARGYSDDGCALSILVVKDTKHMFGSQMTITKALARNSLFGDFDVITPEHFRKTSNIPDTLAYKAINDGYVAYEA